MDKLLTIVIPAYNMKALLPRCLDSLISPNVMEEVEVLIINDGSKDNTLEIAQSYEKRFPGYFKAIDKQNGNYGSVMNKGLEIAQGKYFKTLDADDWYDTNNYTKFVEELKKTDADIVFCERCDYFEEDNRIVRRSFDNDVITNKDLQVSSQFWTNDSILLNASVTSTAYKTNILLESKMKWDEGVFYTDTEYNYIPLKKVNSVRFIPLPVYVYLIGREGQSMNINMIRKNFHSTDVVANRIVDELINVTDKKSEVFSLQKNYLFLILTMFYNSLMYSGLNYKKEIDYLDKKLKNDKDIYYEIANKIKWHGISVIGAYRKGKIPFLLLYTLIITNRLLKSIFQFISLRKKNSHTV